MSNEMPLAENIAKLWLASKRAEIHSLQVLFELSQLIAHLRKMMHYLQLERGSSVLFLVEEQTLPDDINYRVYRKAFCEEHAAFNLLLQKWIEECEGKILAGGVFISLAKALESLDQPLFQVRREIDARAISSLQAAKAISAVIKDLLSVIVEMTELTQEPKIAKLMVALIQILNAKELAGQERAYGTYIIASGLIRDKELAEQRQGLIDMQHYYFSSFEDFAPPETAAAYQAVKQEQGLTVLRNAFENEALLGVEQAQQWFAACTLRIEAIQKIEECLIQLLQLYSAKALHQADQLLNQDQRWIADNIQERAIVIGAASSATSMLMDKLNQQGKDLKQTQQALTASKQTLLEQRVIQQAKAKIMKQLGLSEEAAHRKMQQAAMQQGMRLIDLAKQLIEK
ncbi:nitrate regulatory protein [Thiosulfatimonas sediminis]|uniref:Nitrate regulatory protein n=1 Tax=Thiosulfatimonas sediminis TaxID=2675054 RepID=A0A6F8PW80_9GAMM|nr:nitrate- and nitrite sensing domain-containing protein [Thiosulfatimonas sediminis]BBP46230.1 nitrate regulatory protein [Thiosulfatimonas sediminis]